MHRLTFLFFTALGMKVAVSLNSFVAIHRLFGVTLCLHNLPRRLVQLVTPKLCYLSTKLHGVTSLRSSDSLVIVVTSKADNFTLSARSCFAFYRKTTWQICVFAWVLLLYIISEPFPNVLKPSGNMYHLLQKQVTLHLAHSAFACACNAYNSNQQLLP
jgi:hypothetical protein